MIKIAGGKGKMRKPKAKPSSKPKSKPRYK
jgi:hypothetical protein